MASISRRYLNGPGGPYGMVTETGERRYFKCDHQGTVQCITDETGAVTDRFASDAWGVQVKRTGNTINRNWYIGGRGYQRQTQLPNVYCARTRYIDAGRGRTFATDPQFSPREKAPQYAYVPSRGILNPYSFIPTNPPVGRQAIAASLKGRNIPGGGLQMVTNKFVPGTCGDFQWCVGFILPQGAKQGAVIQHIKADGYVKECDEAGRITKEIHYDYWEIWPVTYNQSNNSYVISCSWPTVTPNSNPQHDCYTIYAVKDMCKRGFTSITGMITYIEGYVFVPQNAGGPWGPPPAGLSICNATIPGNGPAPTNIGQMIPHYLFADFDCCPCGDSPCPPNTTNVITVPLVTT